MIADAHEQFVVQDSEQRTQFLLGTRGYECRDEELTPSLLLSPLDD